MIRFASAKTPQYPPICRGSGKQQEYQLSWRLLQKKVVGEDANNHFSTTVMKQLIILVMNISSGQLKWMLFDDIYILCDTGSIFSKSFDIQIDPFDCHLQIKVI